MPSIRLETVIAASPDMCFDLSRDLDLHIRGFQHTDERIIAGRTSGLIGPGEEVTWQARHLGFVHRHRSRITAYERPRHFRDEMVEGRFKSFIHDHYFEPVEAGTLMRDVVAFASPLGFIGQAVNVLFLTRYLTRLISERNKVIKLEAETASSVRS